MSVSLRVKLLSQAGLIGHCILEVEFGISGGMRCFRFLHPNVESEPDLVHQNSRMMRTQEGELLLDFVKMSPMSPDYLCAIL